MVSTTIQDRTNEFRTILTQAQKRNTATKGGPQRQSLLTDAERHEANGASSNPSKPGRSEFARNALQIGRGISATMGKLERLAQRKLIDPSPPCSPLEVATKTPFQSPNEKQSSTTDLSKSPNSPMSSNKTSLLSTPKSHPCNNLLSPAIPPPPTHALPIKKASIIKMLS